MQQGGGDTPLSPFHPIAVHRQHVIFSTHHVFSFFLLFATLSHGTNLAHGIWHHISLPLSIPLATQMIPHPLSLLSFFCDFILSYRTRSTKK
jgi:hypothetical protein